MPFGPSLAEVIRRHEAALLAMPGVVGVGEGARDGAPCVVVMVAVATPDLRRQLPATLDDVPVQVVETGTIEARD